MSESTAPFESFTYSPIHDRLYRYHAEFSIPARALVSGANGFVVVCVVCTLLEKGYTICGTVRSADKGPISLKNVGDYGDKLEIMELYGSMEVLFLVQSCMIAADASEQEGPFDEAVKGVDAMGTLLPASREHRGIARYVVLVYYEAVRTKFCFQSWYDARFGRICGDARKGNTRQKSRTQGRPGNI